MPQPNVYRCRAVIQGEEWMIDVVESLNPPLVEVYKCEKGVWHMKTYRTLENLVDGPDFRRRFLQNPLTTLALLIL